MMPVDNSAAAAAAAAPASRRASRRGSAFISTSIPTTTTATSSSIHPKSLASSSSSWLHALLLACLALSWLAQLGANAHTIDLAPHMKQCFFEDLSAEDVSTCFACLLAGEGWTPGLMLYTSSFLPISYTAEQPAVHPVLAPLSAPMLQTCQNPSRRFITCPCISIRCPCRLNANAPTTIPTFSTPGTLRYFDTLCLSPSPLRVGRAAVLLDKRSAHLHPNAGLLPCYRSTP